MTPASSDSARTAAGTRAAASWREALRWSATSAPVALLLAGGIAVGPQGSNLLPAAALSLLMPVTSVALAALGVLVGLSVADRRATDGRVAAAAVLHPAIVMSVVALGMGTLIWSSAAAMVSFKALVAAWGICAATSLTLPTGNPLEPKPLVARLSEAGTWAPILAGGVLLAAIRAATPLGALALVLQVSAVTIALAAAGGLLLRRPSSATEDRVFALSALLLVGGAADALAGSALLAGLVAGVVWRFAGGRSRDSIARDVLFVQHPLLVLVLLVAGARCEVSLPALAFGLTYGALRALGVAAGAAAAARMLGAHWPGGAARLLMRPGVFGVALALNAASVSGSDAALLLGVVVLGTIVSELLALLMPARSAAA